MATPPATPQQSPMGPGMQPSMGPGPIPPAISPLKVDQYEIPDYAQGDVINIFADFAHLARILTAWCMCHGACYGGASDAPQNKALEPQYKALEPKFVSKVLQLSALMLQNKILGPIAASIQVQNDKPNEYPLFISRAFDEFAAMSMTGIKDTIFIDGDFDKFAANPILDKNKKEDRDKIEAILRRVGTPRSYERSVAAWFKSSYEGRIKFARDNGYEPASLLHPSRNLGANDPLDPPQEGS